MFRLQIADEFTSPTGLRRGSVCVAIMEFAFLEKNAKMNQRK